MTNELQQDITQWQARGNKLGASHLLVVCDTFDYEYYPVLVMPHEYLQATRAEYDGPNMQRVMETKPLAAEFERQCQQLRLAGLTRDSNGELLA